jgi:predicted DNA-binding protein
VARQARYTEQTSLKLAAAMKERVKRAAEAHKVSEGDVIRWCIDRAIDDVERDLSAKPASAGAA